MEDELSTILEQFAQWTIKNVEHGIYIPLPSPETESKLQHLIDEAYQRGRKDEAEANQ